jgi:membrane-associated protease RseP (regulator of RpoE activity)
VNITTANITSGNIGEDTRNAIAWRRAWVQRLTECDQYVENYVRSILPSTLIYSTELTKGEIDWDKETIPISFAINLQPDRNWPNPIIGVVDAVYTGLSETGQSAVWKLDNWPNKNASGGNSKVAWNKTVKYDTVVELLNDQGLVIGRQNVSLSAGWVTNFNKGKTTKTESATTTTVTFPAVDVNKITDKLTIRVVSLDGTNAETAAQTKKVSILTQSDYQKVHIASGEFGPAGGEIIVVNGRKLEVAPASTEFMANWSDAKSRCASLRVNGIGGWRLPDKDELNAMYTQLKKNWLGGFSDFWYWSSSKNVNDSFNYFAWSQRFSDGRWDGSTGKDNELKVRAVRELAGEKEEKTSGWLGVSLSDPDKDMKEAMGLTDKRGAMAFQVFLGSPADKGGIKPGDYITHVDGKEVQNYAHLSRMVGDIAAGSQAVFRLIRDKKQIDVTVRIEARSEEVAADNKKLWPGLVVVPMTDSVRESLKKGLYVSSVYDGTPAKILGLQRGDRITSVNGKNVTDLLSFYRLLGEAGTELQFGYIRGNSSFKTNTFKRD